MATSTARVLRHQARQRARRIVLPVEVDGAGLSEIMSEVGMADEVGVRVAMSRHVAEVVDNWIQEQLRKLRED